MFILKSKEQLTKAIENAKALHPKVRMVEFGGYEVTDSKGNTYTVHCYRSGGEKIVDCNARRECRAKTRQPPCKSTSTWPHAEATNKR